MIRSVSYMRKLSRDTEDWSEVDPGYASLARRGHLDKGEGK